MVDEARRKELAVEHCRRVNEGDLDGLLKLYDEAVRFEDPVGSGWRVGHAAFRAHAGAAIAGQVYEEYGEPVACQDGLHAAVPVTATMNYLPNGPFLAQYGVVEPPADPRRARMRVRYVMFVKVGPSGLIEEMRAFWGRSDVSVL
ncbi:nuclear transport factor 2 family protein [Kitasatospora sp. NPDC006697]|uniref:nuclear transport factor 2 family protein n=1 Tax=Kitasatospora sp. NPDC006697 TaxID=3364020 RepID=UPI0036785104